MSRRCQSAAASGRASWSLLLLVMLLAAPIFSAVVVNAAEDHHDHDHEGHHEDEPPLEYLMELYDKDGGKTLNATELKSLFDSLHDATTGGHAKEEEDVHAGHSHGAPAATPAAPAITERLTLKHIIEHYADNDTNGLNETAFVAACPAMLKCALEPGCEFEHDEEEEAHESSAHVGREEVTLKLICLAIIFIEALLGGILPLYIMRSLARADAFMSLLNAFSGGIFLTTGLTHILPHVVESAAEVDYGEYPLPYALVMLGYMLIFLVERVLFHSHAHTLESEDDHEHETQGRSGGLAAHDSGHAHGHGAHGHSHGKEGPLSLGVKLVASAPVPGAKKDPNAFSNSLVILVAISLHAILAGVSLGIQSERTKVIAVAVAICSHKAPAAFSIGSKFMRNGMAVSQVLALVFIFALVTPVGIGIGIGVGSSSPLAALILEGLAAGTFIYVGATEISTDEFETTARACDMAHSDRKKGAMAGDEEGAGGAGGDHTHRVHAPPGRLARLGAFTAYAMGCVVILLTNLAPHAD